jgi:hypothetical protein
MNKKPLRDPERFFIGGIKRGPELLKQLAYQTKSYRDFILQNSTKYVDE